MRIVMAAVLTLAVNSGTGADVSYVEQIVNSGFGAKKSGARKTTSFVYIKGSRQQVRSEIKTSQKQARVLSQQGLPLTGSTILQLDSGNLYRIDLSRQTYTQARLPAAKPVAAAKKAAANPTREVSFRVRQLAETKSIDGIACRRVAAEMRVRHYQPGTRKVRRENRYLYQAWVADDFPGYEEIERFRQMQAKKTSHPSLIGGGLEQMAKFVDDYDELAEEIVALEGFAMQSVIKVFTTSAGGGEEKQVFQLSRTVKALSHETLSDSLFAVSKGLRRESY